ncbi:MAG: TIR domain-containing protein [Promethearchaeota archaeon]
MIHISIFETLEEQGVEIQSEFLDFLQKVTLEYHPTGPNVMGFSDFDWPTLSDSLQTKQREIIALYRKWYYKLKDLISINLGDELESFQSKYKSKNHEGVLDFLQLKPQVWNRDKSDIIRGFKEVFNEQLSFLSSIKLMEDSTKMISQVVNSEKIFIVHGHDEEMKQAVARFIEKIGLEAKILHEQPNKGRTIIQKFIDYSDVGFVIVLLSPDDKAKAISSPKSARYHFRARQNVIFELGYFIGKLGLERVIGLFRKDKDFEIPSDYNGVIYISYEGENEWKLAIIKELNANGYEIDANLIL